MNKTFTIEGDFGMFDRLQEAAKQAFANAAEKVMLFTQADARNNISKNTGITASKIDYRLVQAGDGTIDAKIGLFGDYAVVGASLENGSKPHFPWDKKRNVNPLIEWVRLKGLTGSQGTGKGNIKEVETIAFLIARKIARVGTSPKPFLTPAVLSGNGKFQGFLDGEIRRMRISK